MVSSLLGEKWRFLFFMFTERLELIKGRKQFGTAPHLEFEKFHHNKRIAIKLQSIFSGLSTTYVLSYGLQILF